MSCNRHLNVCLFFALVTCALISAHAAAPTLPYSSSWQSRRGGGRKDYSHYSRRTPYSGTPFLSRESPNLPSSLASSDVVVLTSSPPKTKRRGKKGKMAKDPDPPPPAAAAVAEEEKEPTLDEMYQALGLFGRSVVGAVDVALVTVTSYLSGALLGYVGGGLFGVTTLFRSSQGPSPGAPPGADQGMRIVDPNSNFFKEAKGRLGNWNGKALSTGKSWGELSAAFSGFHALVRVLRGNVEDKWNGILGSACTGAYMSRKGGPNAMIQGAATYASFTYLIDVFFGTGGTKKRQLPDGTMIDDQFEFKDEPVY